MSSHSPEAALRNRLFIADRPDCKRQAVYNRPVVSPQQNMQSSFDSAALFFYYSCYRHCAQHTPKKSHFIRVLGDISESKIPFCPTVNENVWYDCGLIIQHHICSISDIVFFLFICNYSTNVSWCSLLLNHQQPSPHRDD